MLSRSLPRSLPALLLALVALGCGRASPEAIERWKREPEGADKLAAAVGDARLGAELRARAATALVESGGVDRAEAAVAGLPIDDRAGVIAALIPQLARLLDAAAAQAGDAREALYSLREQATADAAKSGIDAVLLPALEKDLRADRPRVGRMAIKDMLVGVGPASVPMLQRVLDDGAAPFAGTVEILDKVGDGPAREQGGAALVKRARAAPPVAPALWSAIATLGGKDVVAFLQDRVEHGAPAEAESAAETMTKLRREPALLPFALRVAAAPATAAKVREHLFEVVEKIGSEEAREGLAKLVGAAPDPAIRYRAFDAALKVGRGKAIVPSLEALPQDTKYTAEEVREHLVRPLASMPGLDSREGLFKCLESKVPLARLVAVLVLEKMGFASDAGPIGKLAGDKGRVQGLRGQTVGTEAERVAAVLRKTPG
jgi:hypothetical protein